MPAAPPQTKACIQCLQVLPLAEFRLQHRGESRRMNDCNFCHNRYERVRRHNLRLKGRDKTIARFATQLRLAPDANRMLLLCRQMFQRYGGVEGFAKAWAQQARRARPGSKQALNFFVGVASLTKHIKDTRPPVKELDDANLGDELAMAVARLVQDRPELAVEALQRLGWQVVSPNQGR